MTFICNAIIDSVQITNDDHGVLSAWLMLSYDGAGQGFGGFCLYAPPNGMREDLPGNFTGLFIWRCLEVAGVTSWDKLPGKTIRVEKTDSWGAILKIGHIVKDMWFDPKAEFEQLQKAFPAQEEK